MNNPRKESLPIFHRRLDILLSHGLHLLFNLHSTTLRQHVHHAIHRPPLDRYYPLRMLSIRPRYIQMLTLSANLGSPQQGRKGGPGSMRCGRGTETGVLVFVHVLVGETWKRIQDANSFHEKAGECQPFSCIFSFFFFISFFSKLFPLSQAASVATLPSALFVERLSLGASWVYSIQ
jgi:hypothetical protein